MVYEFVVYLFAPSSSFSRFLIHASYFELFLIWSRDRSKCWIFSFLRIICKQSTQTYSELYKMLIELNQTITNLIHFIPKFSIDRNVILRMKADSKIDMATSTTKRNNHQIIIFRYSVYHPLYFAVRMCSRTSCLLITRLLCHITIK